MNIKKFYFMIYVFFLSISSSSYSIENKIIYKLNDQIITHVDVINESKYLSLLNPKIIQLGDQQIYQISKESLLREKIKIIEILNQRKKINTDNINIILNDDKLDIFIQKIYQNLGFTSYDDFKNYIESNKFDFELLKQKISVEILWNELIFFKFKDKVKINEKELQIELTEIKKNNTSLLLYEILIDLDDNIEEKFQLIKKSIKKNGIENTALIYSKSDSSSVGGKIGWINKLSLSPIIKENVSKIKKDEFTNPIRIPSGFIVLFIKDEKIESQNFDRDLEKKKLIEIKTNQQLNQFSSMHFNKIKKNIKLNEI